MRSLLHVLSVVVMATMATVAFAGGVLFARTLIWTSAAPATAVAGAGVAQGSVAPGSYIAWEPSFESALERARTSSKPILVDFYTDWCPHCKEMEQTYMAPEVIAIAGNVVAVRVNAEQRSDLASQYGVNSYPTIMALTSSGGIQNRFSGSYPPAEFAGWLRSNFPSAVPS